MTVSTTFSVTVTGLSTMTVCTSITVLPSTIFSTMTVSTTFSVTVTGFSTSTVTIFSTTSVSPPQATAAIATAISPAKAISANRVPVIAGYFNIPKFFFRFSVTIYTPL